MSLREATKLTLNNDPAVLLPMIVNKAGVLKKPEARDIYLYMWSTYYLGAKKEAANKFARKTKGRRFSHDMEDLIRNECFAINDVKSCVEISTKDMVEETGILQPNIVRAIKVLEADGFITCLKKGSRWNPKATYQINIGIFELMEMIGMEKLIAWELLKKLKLWKEAGKCDEPGNEPSGGGQDPTTQDSSTSEDAHTAPENDFDEVNFEDGQSVNSHPFSASEALICSEIVIPRATRTEFIDGIPYEVDDDGSEQSDQLSSSPHTDPTGLTVSRSSMDSHTEWNNTEMAMPDNIPQWDDSIPF